MALVLSVIASDDARNAVGSVLPERERDGFFERQVRGEPQSVSFGGVGFSAGVTDVTRAAMPDG